MLQVDNAFMGNVPAVLLLFDGHLSSLTETYASPSRFSRINLLHRYLLSQVLFWSRYFAGLNSCASLLELSQRVKLLRLLLNGRSMKLVTTAPVCPNWCQIVFMPVAIVSVGRPANLDALVVPWVLP
ncbi:hypothetical protein Moror_16488 [Moniliophthora roreri MCA 2997]|uniref:Uncharacterized protein n=1 Tax=Moniliophthora roreri (strain MCA 2997) TaxID=1381753 RepID=V2XEB7_MONRO|nr:hypothetical protein Moror_16488 [Moniliophthora roreri MCA 2997]